MTRGKALTPSMALLLLTLAVFTGKATAQKTANEELVGTWTLVLVENVLPDGSRVSFMAPIRRAS